MGFLPVIGESLSFVKAHKVNRGQEWVEERVVKYIPIFKTSLMGGPTVFITSRAGSKFVLGAEIEVLAPKKAFAIAAIMGKQNLFEVSGTKRYMIIYPYMTQVHFSVQCALIVCTRRKAMMSFIRPDILQQHIKHMDGMVKARIDNETKGRQTITIVAFMKKLTFHVACQIFFGITNDPTEQALYEEFRHCFEAMWSAPFNFPGTTFRKGIQARKRIVKTIMVIKKNPLQLMKLLINLLMIASHDSSAAVLTWVIWKLAKDREIYDNVVRDETKQRQQQGGGETDGLKWGDVSKMKYTWRVVQEVMRVILPFFGGFRLAIKDTSYGGYDIPKG
ncbi:hypothetical protein MKW98_028330 [Papaver atlanticum]|uniref:Cytochrome P450 n=1 Tax=Papaver atlanticum TaxID=357466 RepID=A0AAD4SZ95_9MAGN|nr:hypothetical protein MKW98_028330 [Papaver atlanticum]